MVAAQAKLAPHDEARIVKPPEPEPKQRAPTVSGFLRFLAFLAVGVVSAAAVGMNPVLVEPFRGVHYAVTAFAPVWALLIPSIIAFFAFKRRRGQSLLAAEWAMFVVAASVLVFGIVAGILLVANTVLDRSPIEEHRAKVLTVHASPFSLTGGPVEVVTTSWRANAGTITIDASQVAPAPILAALQPGDQVLVQTRRGFLHLERPIAIRMVHEGSEPP
jgi:hypothetical protein